MHGTLWLNLWITATGAYIYKSPNTSPFLPFSHNGTTTPSYHDVTIFSRTPTKISACFSSKINIGLNLTAL